MRDFCLKDLRMLPRISEMLAEVDLKRFVYEKR